MTIIIQYIAVLLALFGPKFGIIDSRLFLLPIMLIFYKKNNYIFPKVHITLFCILLFLFFYSFFLFLFFPPNPEFLRYLRSFVSLISLPLILNYQSDSRKLLDIVLNVLILHPISIFLSLLFPSFQLFLADLFQFVAESRNLRYNGLTAGFDIAGYLSISGSIICLYSSYIIKEKKYLFMLLLFFSSVFLTSRTSIIVLVAITLILLINFLFKNELSFKKVVFFLVFLLSFSLIIYTYVLPNLISTINIELFSNFEDLGNEEAVLTYAKTDPIQMILDFIILPKTNLGLFFGENFSPLSDSGYIQTINSIGIFGLFISILFYFIIYFHSKKILINYRINISLKKALKIIILLTLLLCVKNQYLFTRGTFELIILLLLIIRLPEKRAIISI